MDTHFSENIIMNLVYWEIFLANLEIFKYICTQDCTNTPLQA